MNTTLAHRVERHRDYGGEKRRNTSIIDPLFQELLASVNGANESTAVRLLQETPTVRTTDPDRGVVLHHDYVVVALGAHFFDMIDVDDRRSMGAFELGGSSLASSSDIVMRITCARLRYAAVRNSMWR